MFRTLNIITVVILGWLIAATAALLLPACGLVGEFSFVTMNSCPPPEQVNGAMDDGRTRQVWLEARLAQLSRQLRERACEPADTVEEVVVLLPEPPAPRPDRPVTESEPPESGEVDWSTESTSLLEGCWNVIPLLSYLRSWRMCFDGQGDGDQVLVYDDGLRCEVQAKTWFDAGTLVIRDQGRWQCDDGGTDIPHEATCEITPDGPANCVARHLGYPGEHRFSLRR